MSALGLGYDSGKSLPSEVGPVKGKLVDAASGNAIVCYSVKAFAFLRGLFFGFLRIRLEAA